MAATVAIAVRLFEPDDIAAVRALYAAAMQVPRGGGGGATTASPSPCHPSVAKFIRAQLRGPLASAATVADRFATDDDHRAGAGAGASPADVTAVRAGFWVATASGADTPEVIVGCVAVAAFQESAETHDADRPTASDGAAAAGPPSPPAPCPHAELK